MASTAIATSAPDSVAVRGFHIDQNMQGSSNELREMNRGRGCRAGIRQWPGSGRLAGVTAIGQESCRAGRCPGRPKPLYTARPMIAGVRSAFWMLALLTTAPTGAGSLPPDIDAALSASGLDSAFVSIVIAEAHTGRLRVALNASAPRSPASTLKLVTTYAALDLLGPAYTWKTRAWSTGPISDGKLSGDLVLEGGGDPELTAERWWQFSQALRASGLRRVS